MINIQPQYKMFQLRVSVIPWLKQSVSHQIFFSDKHVLLVRIIVGVVPVV